MPVKPSVELIPSQYLIQHKGAPTPSGAAPGSITHSIFITRAPQVDGSVRWKVNASQYGDVILNQLAKWEYEPLPSNRDEDFYRRCRFATVEDAVFAFERWRARVPGGCPGQNQSNHMELCR